MTSLNISLPESMRTYIDQQMALLGYSTASEYIRDLIRQEQKRQATQRLETLLLEGLESGKATDMTEQDWLDIRQAVAQKLANRQQNKK
ncbi:type II toxin-antitoxin system ParD family antitoxin [Geminocystis sp. GBBB08]|uniref:type II toxin-antitoxin system ParD family antitoxin n=1 Tax=Geminocystis sp. GBBB08 TaxID=2604140 RepID=UPI0027E33A71|nr:type II toxin-antitoxin system ParD family antitoxin [Geminocystis sp. GBBB08]MBL1208243.1 type II toxin-antitoxin system ParD family antitoxin [Geminocystis sp. GBBB08]